jgi:hypothetical protein
MFAKLHKNESNAKENSVFLLVAEVLGGFVKRQFADAAMHLAAGGVTPKPYVESRSDDKSARSSSFYK